MPKKAEGGSTTIDLLDYLFGPGERDEHTDPHLVAAWDPDVPCPARAPDRMSLADLALLLDAPVEALRGPKPAEHVWHVSVRLLVGSRPWPLLAARMNQIREQGGPALLGAHLARLKDDTSFKEASGSTTVGRLVDATLHSLTTPPSAPAAPTSRVRVSPTVARSRSTTTPTAAPGQARRTEPAVAAHRQQAAAPARGRGR